MKLLVVLVGVHFFLLTSAAQQSPMSNAPIASASPQVPAESLRDAVVFLRVEFQDGVVHGGAIGTGFFVGMPDKRLGENQSFFYLVTNRHMAQPGIELNAPHAVTGAIVRLNLAAPQGNIEFVDANIPFGGDVQWHFPKDDAVDLAVVPIAPDSGMYAYKQISVGDIVTSDQVRNGDVVVGDHVLFAGYFSNFSGFKRLEPIVRQGVIAMLPDEDLKTTLQKPGRIYLADLHAFHGNSGSPVLVNALGAHHGQLTIGEHYLLLGIISGYYPESAGYSVPAATVLTGEVHDNSGIATIVPAYELAKLLNSEELQALREKVIASRPHKP